MGASVTWTLDDLIARNAAPGAFVDVGPLRDLPCVVVDTRGSDLSRVTDRLAAALPLVVIAIVDDAAHDRAPVSDGNGHDGGALFDVVVSDPAAADLVAGAVRANPHASTVLVQLLRMQSRLSPLDALAAESLAYATLQGGHEFTRWLTGRGTRVRTPDTRPRVRVEHTDHATTAVVTLDRPRLFNLYDAAMRDALVDTMRALVADDAVVRIELRGAGKAFCAGGDPGEFGTTRDTALAHLIRSSANAAPLLLAAAPKLHAFVHGAAVGAGCELAAFAARVTASADATFALPEVSMGLVPGAGGTVSVTRRIGRHRTAWLALTGARVDATTAHAWGLVDEVA